MKLPTKEDWIWANTQSLGTMILMVVEHSIQVVDIPTNPMRRPTF